MHRYDQINNFLETSAFFYTIAVGMDGIYIYVSPNYDHNFSFGKRTLKGQEFSVTLHPDDIRICEEIGQKCFEYPKELFPATLRKLDGKGGFVITQWEMKAILDEKGLPQGIFCIGYNITEFIYTREKLNQAENHLIEISFIQSHSVRKPLANIMGINKLLRATNNAGERVKLMSMLDTSANELDQVIKEISEKGERN